MTASHRIDSPGCPTNPPDRATVPEPIAASARTIGLSHGWLAGRAQAT
nr:hypothetical protein [Streptomyces sp. S1D4-11]QIY96230.1 hypothetical protein HEP87_22190 [Streptomyces sp. S1D4-11]